MDDALAKVGCPVLQTTRSGVFFRNELWRGPGPLSPPGAELVVLFYAIALGNPLCYIKFLFEKGL